MIDEKVNGILIKTLISSMLNSMIRDIYVYKIFTHQETCKTLEVLYDKLLKQSQTFIPEKTLELTPQIIQAKIEDFSYSVIKLKKKDNNSGSLFLTQLSQLPKYSTFCLQIVLNIKQ